MVVCFEHQMGWDPTRFEKVLDLVLVKMGIKTYRLGWTIFIGTTLFFMMIDRLCSGVKQL